MKPEYQPYLRLGRRTALIGFPSIATPVGLWYSVA
jgi:hypothetical protein